jgi:hypothetical protein
MTLLPLTLTMIANTAMDRFSQEPEVWVFGCTAPQTSLATNENEQIAKALHPLSPVSGRGDGSSSSSVLASYY